LIEFRYFYLNEYLFISQHFYLHMDIF